jgi:hypothetical protein
MQVEAWVHQGARQVCSERGDLRPNEVYSESFTSHKLDCSPSQPWTTNSTVVYIECASFSELRAGRYDPFGLFGMWLNDRPHSP